jgi:hypothetical protein
MDKLIIDVLSIEAKKLAKQYSIPKINRVLEIMKNTAIDCRGVATGRIKTVHFGSGQNRPG